MKNFKQYHITTIFCLIDKNKTCALWTKSVTAGLMDGLTAEAFLEFPFCREAWGGGGGGGGGGV